MNINNCNLFTYGTLMCEDIFISVTGQKRQFGSALLHNYICLKVRNEQYPGILKRNDHHVQGVIYYNISKHDMKKLDRFEGDQYIRSLVPVTLTNGSIVRAFTYVFKANLLTQLSGTAWDFDTFLNHGKNSFITQYRHYPRHETE